MLIQMHSHAHQANRFLSRNHRTPCGFVAIWQGEDSAKGGDDCLEKRQCRDPQLVMIMEYIQAGTMPEESKKARELILTQSQV